MDMVGEMEIKTVREEYAKKKEGRIHMCNWDKVEKAVGNLKFFSKLSKPVRLSLLRESDYFFMETGKTVFNEGDFGDLMYIILRGSVNVLKKKKTFYGETINQTIAVLYDGLHFGELAMLGTANKNPRKVL
jgi:Cyclic nucleotide-binding domain